MSERVHALILRLSTVSLLLSLIVAARPGAAQQVVVASARLSSRTLPVAGWDSSKVVLVVEIVGIPLASPSTRPRDQVRVVDDAGRIYTTVGLALGSLESSTFVPEYLRAPNVRSTPPKYLFLVPPGTTRFELRVPSLDPVRFTASVTDAPW